jgi:hypothetical protein
MTHNQHPPKAKLTTSEYLQPLVIASLASAFGFSYSFYYHSDLRRALALSAVEFVVLFWIVLRGNRLVARRGKAIEDADSTKISSSYRQMIKWGLLTFVFLILVGISIFAYREVLNANDRRAKQEQVRQQEEADLVLRTRKFSCMFYSSMSPNQRPSFESEFDAAIAALEVPIVSVEKNWPEGPTLVVYKGSARDAEKIYKSLRLLLPITNYATIPVD